MSKGTQDERDNGQEGTMASALFHSYDRTLRRMQVLNLVEQMSAQQSGFKASLVVNPRTGMAKELTARTARRPRDAEVRTCAGSA